MLFAGHIALAFLLNQTIRSKYAYYRRISDNLSPVYLFIAAMVPDIDFVFYGLVGHHTITHSVTFWSAIYLPLFLRWRTKILPYFAATLSHIVGDIIIAYPPLFYGISDQRYGPVYEWANSVLTHDQFFLVRAVVDLSTVLLFLVVRKKASHSQRLFNSDKDAFLALPILGILIIAIFIAANIHDKVFWFSRAHDWSILVPAYSILAAAHTIIILVILKEARQFLKDKKSESITR